MTFLQRAIGAARLEVPVYRGNRSRPHGHTAGAGRGRPVEPCGRHRSVIGTLRRAGSAPRAARAAAVGVLGNLHLHRRRVSDAGAADPRPTSASCCAPSDSPPRRAYCASSASFRPSAEPFMSCRPCGCSSRWSSPSGRRSTTRARVARLSCASSTGLIGVVAAALFGGAALPAGRRGCILMCTALNDRYPRRTRANTEARQNITAARRSYPARRPALAAPRGCGSC